MNIIIPCGGLGERFLREGYVAPKPLIPAMGKPILFWLLDELHVGPADLIVIAYSADLEKWRMEDRLRKNLGSTKLKIVHLPGPTRGAAETVSIALEALTGEERLQKTMLLDCDSFYRHDVVSKFRACTTNMSVVFRDEGTSPIYSYCELDDKKMICCIREKERISPWANTGCYCFSCGEILLDYCRRTLENGAPVRGEYYMSSVISAMILDDHSWRAECIPSREYVCLGTPLQLRLFCALRSIFPGFRNPTKRVCVIYRAVSFAWHHVGARAGQRRARLRCCRHCLKRWRPCTPTPTIIKEASMVHTWCGFPLNEITHQHPNRLPQQRDTTLLDVVGINDTPRSFCTTNKPLNPCCVHTK